MLLVLTTALHGMVMLLFVLVWLNRLTTLYTINIIRCLIVIIPLPIITINGAIILNSFPFAHRYMNGIYGFTILLRAG